MVVFLLVVCTEILVGFSDIVIGFTEVHFSATEVCLAVFASVFVVEGTSVNAVFLVSVGRSFVVTEMVEEVFGELEFIFDFKVDFRPYCPKERCVLYSV